MLTQNNGWKMPIFVPPCILPSHTGFKSIFTFKAIIKPFNYSNPNFSKTSSNLILELRKASSWPTKRENKTIRKKYVAVKILYKYIIFAINGSAISFFRNFATESANFNEKVRIPQLITQINVRILRKYFKHFATSFFFFSVLDL